MHYVGISTYQFIPYYASAIHKHTYTPILKPSEDSEPTGLKVDIAHTRTHARTHARAHTHTHTHTHTRRQIRVSLGSMTSDFETHAPGSERPGTG